ncbi:hypothetical protein [Desulfovibrio piger]|jgi:hypothetical protein|uniref:hypothetical protein n=1 Tax=Desulfovibrio piger TaxID=901 RepID=UPI0039F5D5D1
MQQITAEIKGLRSLEEAELRLSKLAYQAAVDDARKAINTVRYARERVRRAESRMKEMGLDG